MPARRPRRGEDSGGRPASLAIAAGSLWLPPPLRRDVARCSTRDHRRARRGAVIEDDADFSFAATLDGRRSRRHLPLLDRQRPRRALHEPLQTERSKKAPTLLGLRRRRRTSSPTRPGRRTFSVRRRRRMRSLRRRRRPRRRRRLRGRRRRRRPRPARRVPAAHRPRQRLRLQPPSNRIRLVDPLHGLRARPTSTVDYRLSGGQGRAEAGDRAPALRQERPAPRQRAASATARWTRCAPRRRFTVVMHVPAAPRYCRRYDARHLTIRRAVHSQVVWFQSDSIFGEPAR